MISSMTDGGDPRPNHPKAILMALIGFLSFNVGIGSIMGTLGVLMPHLGTYLEVDAKQIPLGALAMLISSAIVSPQIGSLAVHRSLRGMLVAGALMLAGAWLLLAASRSYFVFLAVYAVLLGPAMAITSSMLAPTLVTRWFHRHRGLALGLVHLTVSMAIMPLAIDWLIEHIGLRSTFLVLAVLPLVTLLPAAFLIIDWPPESAQAGGARHDAPAQTVQERTFTLMQLLRHPLFWALTLALVMPNTSSMLLTQHLVSMAEYWGASHRQAAALASLMSFIGMAGVVLSGYIADRIGGARTLALVAVGGACLWLVLLARLPYAGLAVTIGLIGLFGAGTIPAMHKAYGDAFGRASFSRAAGLMLPATLPITAIGLMAPGTVIHIYHSYAPVCVGMSVALVLATLSGLWASRQKSPQLTQEAA